MDEAVRCQIKIDRPIYEHDQLRKDFDYNKSDKKKCLSLDFDTNFKRIVLKTIPAIEWLSHYKWRKNLLADFISGFTVAIMHIPQGMAYALLGNVPPVVGIYMAFFPVLIYFFLGTSRHNSMGTFAVVCLMTGKAVLEHSDPSYFMKSSINTTSENPVIESVHDRYSPMEVATAVTFTVALFQLVMYVLRLGIVSNLLSETLVSGFTTGAAFQVIASQIKDLLGLKIPKQKGLFVFINTLKCVFDEISETNTAAVVISLVTIFILIANNEVIKPLLAKKSSFPIPIELIAIVLGTLVSRYCSLEEIYSIKVVGEIPSGLPAPNMPPMSLLTSVLLDGFTIAIVSYSITLSMALIFAQKLNYEVDANQELLAQGVGNIFGSFFSCMPFTASLSRSTIQQVVGGKTQIASLVSCFLLLIVLLWIGPFFEPLPKSVLASVIVVALKGMVWQIKQLFRFWKMSKMDAIVWLATFLTVVFVSIEIGLLTGVVMSLATIFVLSLKPYTCLLGSVPGTDLYININRYKGAVEIPGIKIFQYCGGINFATRNIFRSEVLRLVDINPQKELEYRKKLTKYGDEIDVKEPESPNEKIAKLQRKINRELKCLILDFSSLSHLDPSGASMLQIVTESFQKIDIPVYIAACPEPIYEMINKCGLINHKSSIRTFPTVHDAVECATEIFTLSASPISTISRI
ncbi:prestin isoform X2 [Tribolium castaneum]|nr:PREDICTED: solute carrier family 26 member 10 isoform X2 [Tribolium castaneum]XP_008200972.1 PREDICTED: solute carrier family 26 member 10 isoform X2 [Tribolium castaneum]KYB29497.1 Prestin-like Protein [Tribolium castaneum]|eukprot:XP_008200971.1 PREDICTED: solute carrier family 26 member 10 isoform X2 [Tribolium castaneum]